jgi:N-methylhydantoinase B
MRRALRNVPDGDYHAEELMDDDGVETHPVLLKVALRVRGDEAEIDFSGTDRQTLGPTTTGWEEAARCIIGPKVLLDPLHPMNAGAMKPFQVLLPPGSVVLGLPPTSQSNHSDLGAKVCSLMLRVVSEAVPERAVAANSGTSGAVLVYGVDNRPNREGDPFGAGLLFGTAWGGTSSADGISYSLAPLFNCRANVIEFVENETPLVIWEWGTTIDSAGAGAHRGGLGPFITIEAYSTTTCTPLLDSAKFIPEALQGGTPGMSSYGWLLEKDERGSAVSWNGLYPVERMTPLFGLFDDDGRPDPVAGTFGNGTRFLSAKTQIDLEPGQVVRFQTASGAGCGDPFDRTPEAVARDVLNERVSERQAAAVYGVVIGADGAPDAKASAELRARSSHAENGASPPPARFAPWPITNHDLADCAAESHVTTVFEAK